MVWSVEYLEGTASFLHAQQIAGRTRPTISINTLSAPSLILGSSQSESIVTPNELAAQGVELTKRRSGGGLVLMSADTSTQAWLDVYLPRDSALYQTDLGASFAWLGATWVKTLASVIPEHRWDMSTAPPPKSQVERTICFASVGHGEVSTGGRKVVGISQRREQGGAKLQCLMSLIDPVAGVVDFLATDAAQQIKTLKLAAWPLADSYDTSKIVDSFLDHLPTP